MTTASEASGSGRVVGESTTLGFGPFDECPGDEADYVLCEDGKWYRRRINAGVTAMVGTASPHPGSLKRAERIEAAIHSAIMKAVSEGVQVGSPELTAVIDAARDAAMED